MLLIFCLLPTDFFPVMRPLSVNYVEFSLKSRWRSGLFLSLAALVTLVGSAEAIKIAVVTALGKSAEVSDVQKALALDPGNPVLHSRLSPALWRFSGTLESRRSRCRRRVEPRRSNPNKSDYWLTLASACESVRDNACADQALQRALGLSPMVPQVWWVAGNHYLRTDRPEAALPCFHRLLELSPDYAAPTFDLTLRAYGNPKMILEKVVGDEKDPQLGLAFADFMSANNEFDAAHQAWTQIAGGSRAVPLCGRTALPRALIGSRAVSGSSGHLVESRGSGASSPNLRIASRAIWCSTAALNNRP